MPRGSRSPGAGLVLASLLVPTVTAQTQASSGKFARIVTVQPIEGQRQAFGDGCKRHLAGHRAYSEPWVANVAPLADCMSQGLLSAGGGRVLRDRGPWRLVGEVWGEVVGGME